MTGLPRHITITAAIVAMHVALVWALNSGLRARPVEVFVPVQMLADLLTLPKPVAQTPATPVAPEPSSKPRQKTSTRTQSVNPVDKPSPESEPATALPVAALPTLRPPAVDLAPAPTSPVATSGASTAQSQAPVSNPAQAAASVSAGTAKLTPAPPLPAARLEVLIELPSTDVQHHEIPKSDYPPISRRLGEQGTVLIHVLVSDKGLAQDAQIKTSSGYFRLDDAALKLVRSWRFVPGKRAGVPEAMWATVPITFRLR